MKAFDLIALLMHIMSESTSLGYLALGCMGLMVARNDFKRSILQKNNEHSILETIIKSLKLTPPKSTEFKYLLRAL